jgi:tetratricopeptide (TPR) repeat protein
MIIVIPIDDFSNTIFFNSNNDKEELIKKLKEFFKIDSEMPTISDEGSYIRVEIDTKKIEVAGIKYNELLRLCEFRNFDKALNLAKELASEYPTVSEYHRLLGQIYSELNEQEEAINSLIDALRWNPKNEWALLMMGNIFVKHKNDVDTALIYYNQILEHTPDNHLTLNNIGVILYKMGRGEDALNYLQKGLKVNPNYPNTYLALGLIKQNNSLDLEAFDFAIKAISYCTKKDDVYDNSFKLALESAKAYEEIFNGDEVVNGFISELSYKADKAIKIIGDESISTIAKIEFAEVYNKDHHLIKYKPSYDAVTHLVLHELMHLELVIEARNTEENQLFTTNDSCSAKFHDSLSSFSKSLEKKGIPKEASLEFIDSLFHGINNQVYNTPIDLFIEDRIYRRFKVIKPIQFLSLLRMVKEGITATTRKDIIESFPKNIVSVSKIYNLVNALHFRTLFSIDLLADFKATKSELNQAIIFYDEYREYSQDKKEGEEYELVQHWADDLTLDSYFNLVSELDRKKKTIDDVLNDINKDPYNLNESDFSLDRKMKQFLENHENDDVNNAVVMYMVDSLNYFKNHDTEQVKKTALEIATIGIGGIDPKKKGYSVPSIQNSNFSGYKLLAYYYTSWALSAPDVLNSLQLPFHKEYELAQLMNKL